MFTVTPPILLWIGSVFLVSAFVRSVSAANKYQVANLDGWGYGDLTSWSSFPSCHRGWRQSPIDLDPGYSNLEIIDRIEPWRVATNFAGSKEFEIRGRLANNGRTVKFIPDNNVKPLISGGPLPAESFYEPQQIHFHWGNGLTAKLGSEHSLLGKKFPLEMHVVMQSVDPMSRAAKSKDDVVVLGFLFRTTTRRVSRLDWLLRGLPEIRSTGRAIRTPTFNLTSLFPAKLLDNLAFFSYDGSLTTPPCSENVKWVVFENLLPINPAQLQRFYKLLDLNDQHMIDNFRPLQPIKSRPIRYFHPQGVSDIGVSYHLNGNKSSADIVKPIVPTIALLTMLLAF